MSQRDDCIGAVDIGGTKIAVGVVTREGTVLSQHTFPTASHTGWKGCVEEIATALDQCRRKTGLEMKMVGIACTGPVDPLSGSVGKVALLPGWWGCNLTSALADLTGATVAMENDADAAALAEFAWGSGRGAQRFLYVTVSTGIGTGFICNGELYRGAKGVHPEMGHHTIDPLGPFCYCGGRGCWESLASGTALERRFFELCRDGDHIADRVDARTIFELAQARDAVAMRAIEGFLHDLGIGLANVATMLVPDVIALGGGVMQSMMPYLAATQRFVEKRAGEVFFRGTSIRLAELQNRVGLAGAAAVVITRF